MTGQFNPTAELPTSVIPMKRLGSTQDMVSFATASEKVSSQSIDVPRGHSFYTSQRVLGHT